jgi:hypothetical protein
MIGLPCETRVWLASGVTDKEVRIMGTNGDLLRALGAASRTRPATSGVRSSAMVDRAGVAHRKATSLRTR